ncbi:E3 ubiquitin-protein ligase ari-1.1-like [Argopecten irradians]|uniref:E3 ubiquitin-protein ligase ari-1.1-like n=1 Tax=Argopecten irradians TaxID=31199 RepID=UPI0037131CBB
MFESFWRMLGYPIFKYRRLTETSISTIYANPKTVHEVKSAVSKSLGKNVDDIDVINETTILNDDEENFKNGDITEIIFHNPLRRVPRGQKTIRKDMFEGDMADGDRIKMSCGHATTPDNLYRYCFSKLNSRDLEFKCMKCDEIWEFPEISKKADMTDDESEFFSRKMTKVFIENSNDIRECPVCRITCTRQNTEDKRVECVVCKKEGKAMYTFCWDCNELWEIFHCCKKTKIKHAQEILDKCELVTMSYSLIPNVPKVRACPKCKVLIEHDGGCKTMDCGNSTCKLTFCFSCLKSADQYGNLPCGEYSSICEVAPIQRLTRKRK